MPSDTFRTIKAGHAPSPGTCAICGFSERDFVDFNLTLEFYGAVLICVECINELGNVEELDFVPRRDLEAERALSMQLTKTIQEYEGIRRKLEDGLVRVANDFNLDFDNVEPVGNLTVEGEAELARLNKKSVRSKSSYADAF